MCEEQGGSGASSSIKECVWESTGSAGLGARGRDGRGGFGGRRAGKDNGEKKQKQNKTGTCLVRGRFQPKRNNTSLLLLFFQSHMYLISEICVCEASFFVFFPRGHKKFIHWFMH